MRTSLFAAVFFALGAASTVQAASLDGTWARGDGKARVRIAPCGTDVCATNTWIKPGTPSEKAGDVLVMKVDRVSEGLYSGSAFDPQRDMTYKITLEVGTRSMTTKGCILGGLLCKGVAWTRID